MDSKSKQGYTDNPHFETMSSDFLYHINISTSSHDLKKLFSDVKFVCIGGSNGRMLNVAKYLAKELSSYMPETVDFTDLTGSSDRFVMYKVGPVLSASHGMGVPSMSILLNEIFKLLTHAGAKDVTIFRLGSSGGLGIKPGTVVVTTEAVNGEIKPVYEQFILGKRCERASVLDQRIAEDVKSCGTSEDDFEVVLGKTMCAGGFYEEQGRLDGAICHYTAEDKFTFLQKLYDSGVRNIEMECTGLAALTNQVNMKAAIVCVGLLNRLENDQVTTPVEKLHEFEMRPAKIVGRYIKKKLDEAK
ncbi:UPP1 [Bugula neritina]|uniref:UPP1 n=1 Tax=Bugula neritina TaxID=10212 RepID=A0A7J7KM43_BUGNE|nr:UPP1 [Bugula neritina]